MKAAVFETFGGPLTVQNVADPPLPADGARIAVKACGVCRSDWHGWMGHDSDVVLPHVPGHELAGEVVEVGPDVQRWKIGQRVTVPFCCGCGFCAQCSQGQQQICDNYTQPGFTQWGAFAQRTVIRYADVNLVAIPESLDFATAASLGCRFATSFRAVLQQGAVSSGQEVVIWGCGGVGLSAVMIAAAAGARVIAVDIHDKSLELAESFGAADTINGTSCESPVNEIQRLTNGGAHVSIDALGSRQTAYDSVACLRKQGRHVQVGLTLGHDKDPPIPMSLVIANELQIFGSHGLAGHHYPSMLNMVDRGILKPEKLIHQRISLQDACDWLPGMNDFAHAGVTMIDRFE